MNRAAVLTYSLNLDWRGVCPDCSSVTDGEDVTDTPMVGDASVRIYSHCDHCGWEGLGLSPV